MAWPLALKAIMLHGIIVIDALLVAPLGEEALAAMGLAGAIAGLLLGVLFAFSNASQIRTAQAFGSAGDVGLKTAFYCGLLINVTSTVVGMIAVIAFADRVFGSFAPTPSIAGEAAAYINVFLLAVLAEAAGQALSSHFNGCGRTRVSFVSYLIALPVNVIVSMALIHGMGGLPALGVVGAAWGTAVASVIRALFLGAIFLRAHGAFRSVPGWTRRRFRTALGRHMVFSWPIAATFISMTIGNQLCTLIYARMSLNDFVAITLIAPWIQVLGTFGMSWAQATGICVAQLLGRGATEPDLDEFLSRAWRAAFVAAAMVATTYGLFCLSSGWIYGDLEEQTAASLLLFLPILLLLPFPKGSNAICGQTLRASGDTLAVMNIFVAGQWAFKVPLTALFVLYLDLPVFWVVALFLGEEFFKFPLFHRRLLKGDWKRVTLAE